MEKMSFYNGNGKRFSRILPELVILQDDINTVALNHILKNTGLSFIKSGWYYRVQPTTSKQIAKLFLTYNFKTQYMDNMDSENQLLLKFNSEGVKNER